MEKLDRITERLRAALEAKNAARERALARSRELIRHCANTIRAAHRGESENAAKLLSEAGEAARQMVSGLEAHPDLYYTGYTQDALKEYAEASITHALILGSPLPTPEELEVPPPAYLNGLGEAMGEMRRHALDLLRRGDVALSEGVLHSMEDVYSILVTIDFPDSLTGGLRRTTDMVRGVLERTRGDVTVAVRQDALQHALQEAQARMAPGAAPEDIALEIPSE